MAETPVLITPGTGGASIASDAVSGIQYQQIKVVDGTLGSNTALIVNADGTANVRISGSVATAGGSFTGSVSGQVGASIIGTVPVVQSGTVITSVSGVVNIAGSVAAFQQGTIITSISGGVVTSISGGISSVALAGANTVSVVGTIGASIIGLVPVNIVSGGTTGSVSGTVGASIVGQLPAGTATLGSIATLQGTNPWIITGSVQGSFAPSGNQSVSGTVGASIIGNINTTITSIATAGGAIPVTGSFAIGSASVVQQGTWNTSVTQAAGSNPWVMTGSVQGTMSVLGTVPVTQSTNPWIITGSVQGSFSPSGNQSVSGTVQVDVRGSVAVAIISGSIAASFTPPANQSVSGTVQTDVRSSVAVVIIGGSVATATTNSSVMLLNGANTIGSVTALQGTNPWIVTSSVAGGLFPISGSVAATIVGTPNVNAAGSVVAFQGTSPWIVNFQNSSIIALQSGSVVSIGVGSIIAVLQAPSIVGSYAEDAPHTSGDKGLFALNVRNDTLSSVTSTDGDYGALSLGPAGEGIVANAPFTKWISGQTSIMYGASVALLAAQGTSVFTYVTGVQIANMSANNALITFQGASSSILAFTIAPANGGSNMVFPNGLKTTANGAFTASISGVSSVYLSAQGFIAKI